MYREYYRWAVWRLRESLFGTDLDWRGLWLSLANIVTPASQGLDNLGEDGCGKWHTEEDEGFVHEVG